jgi:hypothetical protein
VAFPTPAVVPPTLSAWQFQYAGLTFGHGQPIKIAQVTGIGDLAVIRTGDLSRSRDHGELIGLDLYGGRDISIDLEAEDAGSGVQATLLTLAAATVVGATTEQPLWFQVTGYPLLCVMCRPRKRTAPWDVGYQIGKVGVVSTQFHATDPRLYAATLTATVGLASPTTGATFPVTFPMTFGTVAPSGVTVTNAGNTETRPVLVITGPVTNPSVANSTITGAPTLQFSNPNQVGYTVNSGDQLVIDTDTHSILYYVGGVSSGSAPASRGGWLVSGSTWWDLPPGASLIQFLSQDSASVAGTVQIIWASAYQL